jgi:hypothetical protein
LKFLKCSYCVQKMFNSFDYLSNMFLICTHKRNILKNQYVQSVPPYTIGGTLDILNTLGILEKTGDVLQRGDYIYLETWGSHTPFTTWGHPPLACCESGPVLQTNS